MPEPASAIDAMATKGSSHLVVSEYATYKRAGRCDETFSAQDCAGKTLSPFLHSGVVSYSTRFSNIEPQ
jgi:hypothetical protein